VKSEAISMLIIFFGIKGIVHKEFILAGQKIGSTYYHDTLQQLCDNVRRLRPKLWRQKNRLLHPNNGPPHTRDFFFYQKQHDCHPPRIILFSVSLLEDKTEGHHFDTSEVMKVGDAEHSHRTRLPG
jgi:hypothetical protein